jgi:outer membrane protein
MSIGSSPRRIASALVALALALGFNAPVRADALLEQAKRLLGGRDATRALALLLPHEAERAGDPGYDYLLGIAALDAGDPQRAVFALERVLAVTPNDLQARAEIARAYYVLGERQNAQREFRTVRAAADTPAAARATIDRYLSAIEPARTKLAGFAEVSVGRDTNVNSATALSQIALPAFGGAIGELAPSSRRQRDNFVGGAAGATLTHDLTDALAVIAALGANGKFNFREDAFDTVAYDASLGGRYTAGRHAFTLAGQHQTFRLANNTFRQSLGGLGQWQWNLGPLTQLSAYLQAARLHYPTQVVRDADRRIAGVAAAQGFGGGWNPIVFASLYGGEEKTQDRSAANLGFKPIGLRWGAQINVHARAQLFAGGAYERRRYDADEPLFLVRREDRQTDYRLGLNVMFAAGWALIPSVSHTENRSNVELNRYSRTLSSIAVRRDF